MTVLYSTCKRMIERGKLDGMSTKLDIFYAANKLTDSEYAELTALLSELLAAKEKEAADGKNDS